MALIKRLNIYQKITPNIDNGRHYILSKQDYLNFLNENYLIKSLDIDNYRINGNVAKINGIIDGVTYVIDYEYDDQTNNINYFKCYYVNSISIQAGYTNLQLNVDLWGSYIADAHLSNGIITRCNRNISNGIYEDIKATNGNLEHVEAWHQTDAYEGGIFDSDVCIVFLLQYNVAQAIFGNDKISKTELFMINLRELKQKAVALKADFDNFSSAEIAVDIIGGIYGVNDIVGSLDAQVLKAWLCHQYYINIDNDISIMRGITAKSKSIFTNGTEMSFNITHVYPSKKYKKITIENYDINKVYYAGTFNNGLKLQRYTTPNLTYCTYYIVGDDDIQVIVQQGENQKDISSAFEVLLTTNSATETGIRRVARAISTTMKAYSSAMKAYANAGAFGALASGAETLASMVDMSVDFESAIGGGDGFTTFYQEQFREAAKGQLLTPYILTTFTSVFDEKEKARYNGALFNKRINDGLIINQLDEIKNNYELLGMGTFTDTYIQINSAITELPLEASNYIRNKLISGIYYN